jgi:ribosome biogenesis GTPase
VKRIVRNALTELGFTEDFRRAIENLGEHSDQELIGRVRRIDRGWSTFLCVPRAEIAAANTLAERRVRNLGADIAVGDWIIVAGDGERILSVLPRRSRLVRRASSDDVRAEAHTIAANLDVVFIVHALDRAMNERRLERELVLAFDSGALPIVVLTKSDSIETDDVQRAQAAIEAISMNVPVYVVSSLTGQGLDALRSHVRNGATAAVLGSSGVGKSTLVNALTGSDSQLTGATRSGDKKGRHTTTAVDLVPLPDHGWLIDTPGLRAIGLWSSGHGIERAFADVFAVAEKCRFRDCKHEQEPHCAVRESIATGSLSEARVESMRRLVAEDAALEHAQQRAARR